MLCSTCSSIEFAQYFKNAVHSRHNKNYLVAPSKDATCLGSLEEILQKIEICSFCRLLITACCRRWEPLQWWSHEDLIQQCRTWNIGETCYIYSYLYASNDGHIPGIEKSPPELQGASKAYRIGIGLRPSEDEIIPVMDHAADIQLTAETATRLGLSDQFHGRVLDPTKTISMTLIRSWLNLCESQHGKRCEIPSAKPEHAVPDLLPEDLLVIDVRHMCLRSMLPGERYLALSYCWPEETSKAYTTTRSNVMDLFKPRSLAGVISILSPIIQDAIHFVLELGEPYLWIDALCIIQDDGDQKQKQIQQMDRVYSAAVLTIIHVESTIPHEGQIGLSGYLLGSRAIIQNTEEVQDLSMATTLLSIDAVTRYSRWSKRAWTFQEQIISKRKLYFTELQVYFQCSCAVFCEDVIGEGRRSTAFVYAEASIDNTCGIDVVHLQAGTNSTKWISRSPPRDHFETIDTYMRLFEQFSVRKMSSSGDIVFAFQGILSLLSRLVETSTLAGLPDVYLHETLLWLEAGEHKRRKVSAGDAIIMPYPSWSWAGWETEATYNWLFVGYILPEVDWLIIDVQAGNIWKIHTVETYHPKLHIDNKVVRPQNVPPELLGLPKLHGKSLITGGVWRTTYLLACWTTVASFKLTGESLDLKTLRGGKLGGTLWQQYHNVIIFDKAGNAAGSILLETRRMAEILGIRQDFEFILLSRSNTLAKIALFNSDVFNHREWCYINVMLIERTGEVATRVGVGIIHEDAWVAAKPVEQLVKLQ